MKKIILALLTTLSLAACSAEKTGTRGVVLTENGVTVIHRNSRMAATTTEAVRRYCSSSSTSFAQENRAKNFKDKFGEDSFEASVNSRIQQFKAERMPCKLQSEEEKKAGRGISGDIYNQAGYFRVCPRDDIPQKAVIDNEIAKSRLVQLELKRHSNPLVNGTDMRIDEKINEAEAKYRSEKMPCRVK